MNLKPRHPRLIAVETTWPALRARREESPTLDRLLNVLVQDARTLAAQPPLARQMVGYRLLGTSREALMRILLWTLAYRVTGAKEFLQRAETEMLAVSAFSDWNPGHFLDVAEMTLALALGYDWLFDALSPETRATVRRAIVEKGLQPGLDTTAGHNGWYRGENNWNQVCLAGMMLGALAIAEDEPQLAEQYMARVREYNPNGLKPYEPDGVYPEGPIYWGYGTAFQVILLAGLESALGTDFGLSASPGFLASASYPREVTGPSGLTFNYGDSESTGLLEAALFWFARKTGRRDVLHFEFDYIAELIAHKEANPGDPTGHRLLALVPVWADDLETRPAPPPNLSWFGRGINPLAIFRTSWTDRNALFLALKGGIARANHGNMDCGSFVLETDGVRWALDLDKQDYESLESKKIYLWGVGQEADRWRVFRINNFSHNTLTIDGQLHRADGRAEIVRFYDRGEDRHAVVDLSAVFAGHAGKVTRGFRVLPNRQVLIQDELSGLRPGEIVRWALVTHAQVEVAGERATLRQDGRTLQAHITAPGAGFEVIPGEPPDDGFNAPNPGVSILIANVRAPESGDLVIRTLLGPGESPLAAPGETTPCESWSAPLPA
jgi:hypothetical protein